MAAKLHFRDTGVLRTLTKLFYRDAGTLRPIVKAFYRDNGVLRQVFAAGAAPGSVAFTNTDVSQVGSLANQTAGYRINSSGIAQRLNRSTYTTHETWLVSGAAADYEVRCVITGSTVAGFNNVWTNCGGSPEWTLNAGLGDAEFASLAFECRPAGGGATLDTWTVTLESERF